MSEPVKKIESAEDRRFTVVPGGGNQPDNSNSVLAGFVVGAILTVTMLVTWSLLRPPQFEMSLTSFSMLDEVFAKEGSARFSSEKGALKRRTMAALRSDVGSEAYNDARNIAVYLFPDLLSDGDMEKEIAAELWAPLEEAIEKNPHSAESRKQFEDLRAEIWNYENPNRKAPQLTAQAKQVIRIYEVISSP